MTTRAVSTEHQRDMLVRFIGEQKLPFTVTLTKGEKRSSAQNRTAWLWFAEIAEQLGDQTAQEVRAFCKLRFGIPILRAENEAFRAIYDERVKPFSYEDKLRFMVEPFEFPVTSRMTVAQQMSYLDAIQRHFAERGIVLTEPDRMAA